jgi:hypothetical protein
MFPWSADRSPVRAPSGGRLVVAAHPVADVSAVHAEMTAHLGPMADSCLAALGHRTLKLGDVVPPFDCLDREKAAARVRHFFIEHNALGVEGYLPSAALAQLDEWTDSPRAVVFLMAMGGHAGFRAAALS